MSDDLQPARWYHLQGEERYGPLDLATIRQLVLQSVVRPDTFVWADGMPDWMPAAQVPALVPPPGHTGTPTPPR